MKKKTPQGFYSRNKYIYQISEKSHNVWDLQAAPKFSVILGPRPSPGPENKNFQKMKKNNPGIYSRNKYTKFQKHLTIFGTSRLPLSFRSFWDRDRAQGPKIKIFKKLKKHPQVITQETSIPNFRNI